MATEAAEQAPAAASDRLHRSNSAESSSKTYSKAKRFELADLLRDCAALVEQNEMDQKVFQKMFRELTEYVSCHGEVKAPEPAASDPPARSAASGDAPFDEPAEVEKDPPPAPEPAPAPDPVPVPVPPPVHRPSTGSRPVEPPGTSQPARKVTTTTTRHIPPPSSTSSRSREEESTLSKDRNVNFFDKIKSNVKEMGQEFTHIAHTGQRAISHAAKNATSHKNAQRAKNDIAAELGGDEWCEEHFTMGCACKAQKRRGSATAGVEIGRPPNPSKPPFQRPVNPNSTLIANGWLEQQRRSKMRFVWKEVLVSLVAGRRPGEETTLWVQRETINPITGTVGLEALHQIPIKGMQDVNYVDFSTDHRFIIQVYNLSDEFVFRTCDNGDAAKNWVSTLRLTREAIINGVPPPKPGDLAGASRRTKTYPGYSEDEKKAESPPQQPQPPPQQQAPTPQQKQQPPPSAQHQQPPQPPSQKKMGVKEMRAICHAHGINTAGMERGQLEAAVAKVQQLQSGRSTPSGPPPAPAQSHVPQSSSLDDSEREARARQMKSDEEAAVRMAAEERERAEAEMRRAALEAEELRRRQHAEYLRQQEILRQQQAQAAAQQKWQEDQRRAEEQRRYQQQQQFYAQQQAQWQQQQRQQQAQQAQWHQHQQQHPQHHPQHHPQQGWNPNQQPAHPPGHQTPPPHPHPQHGHPPPGPQPQAQQAHGQQPHGQPGGASQTDKKWATQANDESDGQASTIAIKHHILIQWALQPPTMQMLRPIQGLLTTIHTVFPPTAGVPGHEHFQKWKPVTMESLCDEAGRPDESKLAKSVKKLRFFLHPDKLPRDLTDEQTFICKMLWDVTSDAWEEYEKRKEDLDWLNQ